MANSYAPKYYIRVTYNNGDSKLITAGNSNPPKVKYYSDMDVEDSLATLRCVARSRRLNVTYQAELIGGRELHI